tara:strand:+ start:333 stop:656 length:324 start_codon:yes stop_codon:yes gene_type:complete
MSRKSFAIKVRSIGPVAEDIVTYLGAEVDDVQPNGAHQHISLLVPRDEINASYTIKKHVEHFEMHGSPCYVDEFEMTVHSCYWSGNGHIHKIINSEEICWEVDDNDD